MIGTLRGDGPVREPNARGGRRPPEFDDQVAEAVDNRGVVLEAGRAMDVTDDLQPLHDAVQVAELSLERREHRERGEPGRLVALLGRQVGADDALREERRPVERAVPGDKAESETRTYQLCDYCFFGGPDKLRPRL